MKKIATEIATVLCLLPLAASIAAADPEPGGPPPTPPDEAFSACANAKQGDGCTVSFGGHEITGTCTPFPGHGLACRPDQPPPR
jgi:hypothetical protein